MIFAQSPQFRKTLSHAQPVLYYCIMSTTNDSSTESVTASLLIFRPFLNRLYLYIKTKRNMAKPRIGTTETTLDFLDIEQFKFDTSTRQITKLHGTQLTSNLLSGKGRISEQQYISIMASLEKKDKYITDDDQKCSTEEIISLPIVHQSASGNRYISVETVNKLLSVESAFTANLDHFVIVDCRFGYEYNGGHIEGALNIHNRNLLYLIFKINCQYFNIDKSRI